MRLKKYFAVFLTVAMLIACMTVGAVESAVSFKLSSDADGKTEVSLGDTVTYTVDITENSGFAGGTLYFRASENLQYVSAKLHSYDFEARIVQAGEYAGCYAIYMMDDVFADRLNGLCTITFRVVGGGQVCVELIPYQITDGDSFLTASVSSSPHFTSVKALEKPVISNVTLPEAVMGYEYELDFQGSDPDFLTWSISGDLPSGLTFENGRISGTPTVYGDFSITVKATLLDALESDPKTFTLTVLEKPRKLELVDEKYEINGDGYLLGTPERTTVTALLSGFKNPERIKVFNANGKEVTGSSVVGTGYTVSLMHGDEKVHTVTVIVKGDTNGDGKIGTLDYQRIRAHYLQTYVLEGAYLLAGKVSGRANIGTLDYQRVRAHYLGNYDLFA